MGCHHIISGKQANDFSGITHAFNFDSKDTFRFSKAPSLDPPIVSHPHSKDTTFRVGIGDQAVRTIFIMSGHHVSVKIGRVKWCHHTAMEK